MELRKRGISGLKHCEGGDLYLCYDGSPQVFIEKVRQGRHFRKLGHGLVPTRVAVDAG
jgi:hypothetical protein